MSALAAFDDIYSPGILESRPAPTADYTPRKTRPSGTRDAPGGRTSEVLPKLVELAMQLGDGISAGLSLYEDVPGTPAICAGPTSAARWSRSTAPSPHDFSPCDITLDRRAAVLTTHSERMYDWISKENTIFRGQMSHDWKPDGVIVRIDAPRAALVH